MTTFAKDKQLNPAAYNQLESLIGQESAERLCAYWNGEPLDRPVLRIFVKDSTHRSTPWPHPGMSKRECEFHVPWHAHWAAAQVGRHRHLAESVPSVGLAFADNVGLLPLLAGGDYAYEANKGHAWVCPWLDVLNNSLPEFNEAHPVVRMLMDALAAACDATGDQAAVQPFVLGMDAMTTLSLFLGAEDLCMVCLEKPPELTAWIEAFDTLFIRLHRHMTDYLAGRGHHVQTSWQHVAAPGTFESLQCDFAAMISPEMFESFAMPSLRRLSEYLDYSLYHLDGTGQTRFLQNMTRLPQLDGIQWNPEPGHTIPGWIDTYKWIKDQGWRLHFNHWDLKHVDNAVAVVKAIGPDNLSMALPPFENVQEAEAAICAIEQAC